MTNIVQQSGVSDFYLKSIISDTTPAADSVLHYYDYLTDSLNPVKHDSSFSFQLKEIILPAEKEDSTEKLPVYNKQSIFYISATHNKKIEPTVRMQINYDWLTGVFIACLIILTWIRFYNFRRIKQLFKAILARHHVNQLMRDGNLSEERITPGLAFIYLASLSVIIHQLGLKYISLWPGLKNSLLVFVVIMGSLAGLWFLKIALIKITGNIFKTKQSAGELILTNLIYNAGIGIVIFPVVIAGFYTANPVVMYVAAGILLMGMGMRFLRSLLVGISTQTFSVVYLFLYLCTLEILPVLFLFRLVSITDS